jgi:hypothetical protein
MVRAKAASASASASASAAAANDVVEDDDRRHDESWWARWLGYLYVTAAS